MATDPTRAPTRRKPYLDKRTKRRQLSVQISEREAEHIERWRVNRGDRSWGETVRNLIAYASGLNTFGERKAYDE